MRSLEREISKLCRKAIEQLLLDKSLKHITINGDNLHAYLGVQRFDYGRADNETAWVRSPVWHGRKCGRRSADHRNRPQCAGKGKLTTHRFFWVKSCRNPISGLDRGSRTCGKNWGSTRISMKNATSTFTSRKGATPKDGPSRYRDVYALVSCLTGNPVRADVAMTGEITLRGQVLPIGGLKEKLLAAHRGGIKTVLIPYENKRDLEEIPDNVIADLQIHPVKRIERFLLSHCRMNLSGMQVVTAK